MSSRRHLALSVLGLVSALAVTPAWGFTPPSGFQDLPVVSGVAQPSALAFAPNGRLFVTEKASGLVRIVTSSTLLATPFLDVNAFIPNGMFFDTWFERGLLGLAFDPAFPANGYLYLYYTVCTVPRPGGTPGTSTGCDQARNRVVRVTATGDVVDPASHVVLLGDIDGSGGNHNGGWLGIGPLDGRLYVSVGEAGVSTRAPDLGSLNGKILRIRTDGTIPADNPFVGQAGARGEIWAYGLRNPFRCRFHPDGRLFCGDVGQFAVEELDVITPGANYGWPTTEGPFDPATYPQFTNPIYSYTHTQGVGAAIIAGEFGAKTNFQGDYPQSFFFADFSQGTISRVILDATGVAVVPPPLPFEPDTGINTVTDMTAGPDGALYYTTYGGNQVRKILVVGNRAPVAVATATPSQGGPPLTVQFSSAGTTDADDDPLTYLWDFGDGTPTSPAANPSHQYTTAGPRTALLTVSDGQTLPGPGTATATVLVGTPPVLTILQPTAGTQFQGGQTIALVGQGTDAEDGTLPSSSLHWRIRLHHNVHLHPYIDDLVGTPQSFQAATSGETDADVSYEIILSGTDSTGLPATATTSLSPVTAQMTFATDPFGLQLVLDGQPRTAPFNVVGVAGVVRTIEAPSPQGGAPFESWSDGGAALHDLVTPTADTTYTATFAGTTITTSTTFVPTTSTSTASTSSTSISSTSVPSSSTAPPSTTTTVVTSTTSSTSSSTPSSTTSSSTSSTSSTLPGGTTTTTAPASTTSTSSSSSSSSIAPTTTVVTSTTSTIASTTSSTAPPSTSSSTSSSTTSSSSSSSIAPTTTVATTSTTSTTVPVCGSSCDDGDACTVDGCDPRAGCTHTPQPDGDLISVRCHVSNVRTGLSATSLCTNTCPRGLMQRVSRAEDMIDSAPQANTRGRCRHRLRVAARVSRALAGRLEILIKRGRVTPEAAAERLGLEVTHLRARIAALPGSYCPAP